MSIAPDNNICIIGAGIGGLSLALGLARVGHPVTVFEQAAELGEVGAGISLSPNAVKGLNFLGVGKDILKLSNIPPVQVTKHFKTAETLVHIDRSKTVEKLGAPYLQMHRADLHNILTTALLAIAPDAIKLNKELVNIQKHPDGYALEFADATTHLANILVGADGLKSTVRRTVFDEPDAEFSGYVAWRGLIPMSQVTIDLDPGSAVFVSPGRIFVRYPVSKGAVQNIVAFAKAKEWATEGWSQTGRLSTLKNKFVDFHPEVRHLLDALPGERIHKWGLFARQPLSSWVNERATILGDAAHPMLPWFGQGAATSIEDAVVMARAIDTFDSIEEALQRYENARRERVTEVHLESLRGGETLMAQDPYTLAKNPLRTEDTLGLTLYDPATVEI